MWFHRVLLFGILGAASSASAMDIAYDCQPKAVIRTLEPDAYGECVRDLQRILGRMTAARLPIEVGPPDAGTIFVGTRDEAVSKGAKDLPELASEEVLLTVQRDCLLLLGGGAPGVRHAVYTWLDRLGCRWFMPGAVGESVPRRRSLKVEPFTYRHAPSFSMRCIWYAWGANSPACARRFADWARRNRQGSDPYIRASHNFDHLVPSDKYFNDHPEYYSLVGGKRQPLQLCTSNPEVIRIAAETIIAAFKKNPAGPHTASLSPNDNNRFCECPACRALDIGQNDPFNPSKPWVTDRLMVFWNGVAERVAKDFPDARLGFYAYMNHTAPPQREKVHPNLAPTLTAQPFCVLHSIADEWCESRQKMRAALARWCELSKNVYIYDYDPPVGHLDLPSPLYTAHATAIPLYHKMGVKGFSWECHDSWAITSPNLWISAQLQWDATRDPNALFDSYINEFFMWAGDAMRRYYESLAACYRQKDVHAGWTDKKITAIYPEGLVRRMRSAMDAALAEAHEDPPQTRVEMVDMGLRYLEGYLMVGQHLVSGGYYSAMAAAETNIEPVLKRLRETNEDFMLKTQPERWLARRLAREQNYLPRMKDFRARNEVWLEFPDTWRVQFEDEVGAPPADWTTPGFDDGAWHRLKGDEMWFKQLDQVSWGTAWGRCTFKVPTECKGKRLFLYVGALDEGGTIHINGQAVHVRLHGMGNGVGWHAPFEFEVTGKIQPGQANTLAVEAQANTSVGGVWRPIWLYTPKGESSDGR
ncbi:MAG: DUF4838 domain-containing protein [Phycisphaerae bacterium]|nr:DUF4838 domain-containing protein [Phycisphaerae bacterium]